MNVTFKPAAQGDADLLVVFMRALYAHEQIAFDEQVARNGLAQLFADESLGRVWLIEVDSAAAGYVVLTYGFSLEFHGRDALIDELFVSEEWRGRGVGLRALEFVAAFCRAQGIDAVHLAVDHANARALSFYQRFGFEAHERYIMTRWLHREE
jgi:ribosomal protein S18 acetylase RimI-like enzyme